MVVTVVLLLSFTLSWVVSFANLYCSVQDFFVRTANQRKGMLASTHLVLRTPEGTKYQAAQKWGLPAVTLRWILESARLGRKADEQRFLVDLPPSPGQSSSSDRLSIVCAVLLSQSHLIPLFQLFATLRVGVKKTHTHTVVLTISQIVLSCFCTLSALMSVVYLAKMSEMPHRVPKLIVTCTNTYLQTSRFSANSPFSKQNISFA